VLPAKGQQRTPPLAAGQPERFSRPRRS